MSGVVNPGGQLEVTGGSSVGAAVSIADGSDVTEGTIADVAVTGDNPGTISAKLRGLLVTLGLVKAKTDNIPPLGQALAAASVPVVLTAIQQTALTPPAAITGFDLEATQLLIKAKTDNLDIALSTRLKPADTLAAVTTVGTITNPVGVTNSSLDVALSTRTKPADQQHAIIDSSALPTGAATEAGHLATIDTSTAKIPSQGQALAAASLPVVLTAAQITALSPPGPTTLSFTFNAAGPSTVLPISAGNSSVGFALEAGTFAGTIQFQQSSDNINWSGVTTVLHSTLQQTSTFTYTNPNPLNLFSIIVGPAALFIRVNCTLYTSGSAVGILSSSALISPFALSLSAGVPGQAVPLIGTLVSGKDNSGFSRMLSVDPNGVLSVSSVPATSVLTRINPSWRQTLALLASNASRKSAMISNETDVSMFLAETATATDISYCAQVPPRGRYLLDGAEAVSGFFNQLPTTGQIVVTERT